VGCARTACAVCALPEWADIPVWADTIRHAVADGDTGHAHRLDDLSAGQGDHAPARCAWRRRGRAAGRVARGHITVARLAQPIRYGGCTTPALTGDGGLCAAAWSTNPSGRRQGAVSARGITAQARVARR